MEHPEGNSRGFVRVPLEPITAEGRRNMREYQHRTLPYRQSSGDGAPLTPSRSWPRSHGNILNSNEYYNEFDSTAEETEEELEEEFEGQSEGFERSRGEFERQSEELERRRPSRLSSSTGDNSSEFSYGSDSGFWESEI
jgi:hypothetical protein